MEKKTYYVSVQASSVLPEQGDAAYEFEIEATDEEISVLQEVFDDKYFSENGTIGRAMTPWKPYHEDQDNDEYDGYLKDAYGIIYRLGTPETRSHIEQMGIL